MSNIIEYKTTTDKDTIAEWCKIAIEHRLHEGVKGMFVKWFKDPSNFNGLAMVFDSGKPIGIAVWLSFEYDADEMADRVNTGCWVNPAYRRLGIGSELVTQIKKISTDDIRGFTGLYNQQEFWVVNGVDGRNIAGIYEMAADLEATPHDLGYFSVPRITDEQLPSGNGIEDGNE